MVVGKTPVAFINPDVFEERVKRPVDRVDEPGLAVKEAFFEQVDTEEPPDAVQHAEGEAALFAARREIVGPLLGIGVDLVQMFPEMFVGIVQDVAVEFPRAPVGVDVLVRAALGEVDPVAAENAQQAIGIPAAVFEEAVVIPRAPRRSEAAEIGGAPGRAARMALRSGSEQISS